MSLRYPSYICPGRSLGPSPFLTICDLPSPLRVQGSLETKEFILNEVARGLDLQPNRFCLLAALLGNYLLTEEELAEFHARLASRAGSSKVSLRWSQPPLSCTTAGAVCTVLDKSIRRLVCGAAGVRKLIIST